MSWSTNNNAFPIVLRNRLRNRNPSGERRSRNRCRFAPCAFLAAIGAAWRCERRRETGKEGNGREGTERAGEAAAAAGRVIVLSGPFSTRTLETADSSSNGTGSTTSARRDRVPPPTPPIPPTPPTPTIASLASSGKSLGNLPCVT